MLSTSLSQTLTLLTHSVDLLSVKDPLSFQAVNASTDQGAFIAYDTSDDAEAQRLREAGFSDSAIYDEWGDETLGETERETIRQELGIS